MSPILVSDVMLAVGGFLCARMLFATLEEGRTERHIDQNINRYLDEKYPPER
jgi:hypothetical protein